MFEPALRRRGSGDPPQHHSDPDAGIFESALRRRGSGAEREPATKRRWPVIFLVVLATALLLAGGVTVYLAQFGQTSLHEELVGVGESFVRLEIPEEISPAFSPAEETHVERQAPDKYLVQGWVDLIGAEGGSERQVFSCVVHKNPWGDWVGEHITLIAQM
jgi:hypothetical protein